MIDAGNILEIIAIGISSWTLIEVVSLGKKVERHDQKLSDLPCMNCGQVNIHQKN